jgi:hypothetical protein
MSACEKMGWGVEWQVSNVTSVTCTLHSMLLKRTMCNITAATAAVLQETNNKHTWMLCYSDMNSWCTQQPSASLMFIEVPH